MNDIRWNWFGRNDLWIVLVLIVLAAASTGWSASKSSSSRKQTESKPDVSEEFFTNGPIPHLKIQVSETNLAVLRTNNRNYVPAILRDGETVYDDVGIHLK